VLQVRGFYNTLGQIASLYLRNSGIPALFRAGAEGKILLKGLCFSGQICFILMP
jgi:hypothetical protein